MARTAADDDVPLSSSHGRGWQGTPYLRQTASGGVGECGGRCRTCPGSKYDAPGVLGRHQQLQLALFELPSLPLRPHSTLLSPCTRATAGHKGVLYKEEDPRFLAGRASPGLRFVWEMGGRSRACSRPTKREAAAGRVCDRDGECLWTLFAQPTILASIVVPQALAYSSVPLACNENLSRALDPLVVGHVHAVSSHSADHHASLICRF